MTDAESRPTWKDAALAGARFGAAYALLETVLLIWEPWLRLPSHVYGPRHAGFSVIAVAAYVLVVGVAAVPVWKLLRRSPIPPERVLGAAGLGALAGVWGVAVVWLWPQRLLDWFVVPFAGVALVGGVTACFDRGRALAWLHRPGFGSAAILAPVWMIAAKFSSASWTVRITAAAAAWLAVAAAGVVVERRGKRRIHPIRSLAGWGTAALALAAASGLLEQQPMRNSVILGPSPGDRPNLLMIVLDTVRADHTSLYGYERNTTPNLQRFAEGATLFTRSYSSGDMTLMSHASLFSGQRADVHGAHFGPDGQPPPPLPPETETLAELLSAEGYRTAAVAANHAYFNEQFGLDQGFELFDYRYDVVPLAHSPEYTLRQALREAVKGWFPDRWSERYARVAEPINEAAAEQLRAFAADERPFFLFVNYMDAHWPYVPPAPYNDLYPGRMKGFDSKRYWRLFRETISGASQPSEQELGHLISQYDGAIAFLDQQVEELLGELHALGLEDDTLIVVTSDHGEDFGLRGLYNHGVSTRQTQVQVPLVIKAPGQRRGSTADQAVNSADVFATVLALLGVQPPPSIQGEPQLSGDVAPRRAVISHSYPSFLAPVHNPKFYRIETAVMSGPFKLIHSTKAEAKLYDLDTDPGEENNFYDPSHPVARALAESLPTGSVPESPGDSQHELTPEAIERLRSLGYLD